MPGPLNKYSGQITQPETQGSSQAMLYATGMSEADMQKAQVGIASMWFEGNPCNMHLLDLAAEVKKGVTAAGLVGMRFNTIGVSDGISMGTDGMSYSLQSRDLIADSIESVMCAQWYDACIVLPGCDKNMPGSLMALGRLNRPGFMIYGGTIRAGHTSTGEPIDIVSAFTCYGAQMMGKMTDAERRDVVRALSRRRRMRRHVHGQHDGDGDRSDGHDAAVQLVAAGARSGQDGRMPPCRRRDSELHGKGHQAARRNDARGIRKRDDNHRWPVGGSTNAVMHLIAMARSVNVPLTIDDFQRTSDRVPYLADLRPSGKYRARRFAQSRRHAGRDEVAARRETAARRLSDDHRQDDCREPGQLAGAFERSNRRASDFRSQSRRRATSASCAATSAPMVPWPRSPARKASSSAAPPIASIPKKTCCTPCSRRKSKRATS